MDVARFGRSKFDWLKGFLELPGGTGRYAGATGGVKRHLLPRDRQHGILDALDMVEVGEIEIAFQRPLSHPRPATFD